MENRGKNSQRKIPKFYSFNDLSLATGIEHSRIYTALRSAEKRGEAEIYSFGSSLRVEQDLYATVLGRHGVEPPEAVVPQLEVYRIPLVAWVFSTSSQWIHQVAERGDLEMARREFIFLSRTEIVRQYGLKRLDKAGGASRALNEIEELGIRLHGDKSALYPDLDAGIYKPLRRKLRVITADSIHAWIESSRMKVPAKETPKPKGRRPGHKDSAPRGAVKPHIEAIREWVEEGRSDEWIAETLGVAAGSVKNSRYRYGIWRWERKKRESVL